MTNSKYFVLVGISFLTVTSVVHFEGFLDDLTIRAQVATPQYDEVSECFNLLDRGRDRTGKLLTEKELALMREVDHYTQGRYNGYEVTKQPTEIQRAIRNRRSRGVPTPVILKWSIRKPYMNYSDSLLGHECGGCVVTSDRSVLNRSIAVTFFFKKSDDVPNPRYRRSEQVYVFRSVETPSKLLQLRKFFDRTKWDRMFNLTMNYRQDSDVIEPFGNTEKALRDEREMSLGNGTLQEKLRSKSRLALWYVSNCYRTPGAKARMKYVMSMVKAGLRLNKYGDCFSEDTERDFGNVAKDSDGFKFYLAFENSIHCPNYVTEKLWRNSFRGLRVPVVFGPTKADVELIAPKNSFIHVEDFQSPADLVKYLDYLDSNFTAYLEYHKWRYSPINETVLPVNYHYITNRNSGMCRLCRRQVLEHHPPTTVPSVMKWMFDKGYVDNQCLQPWTDPSKAEMNEMKKFFASANFYDDSK